jgi:hypothetical protein
LEHCTVKRLTVRIGSAVAHIMPMDLATLSTNDLLCNQKSIRYHEQESHFRYYVAPSFGLYRLAYCWLLRWDLDLLAGASHVSFKEKRNRSTIIERLCISSSCIRSFLLFPQTLTHTLALLFFTALHFTTTAF